MPDHNNGCGAAVAEIAASTELAKGFTLFQIEESLVLLAESAEEEGLTPEIEQSLTVYLEGAAEKRDRVAEFIHFCEGMAEELINALTQLSGLRVAARTSAFQFKAQNLDIQNIGRQLHATHLIEGSIRKAGDRVRVTVLGRMRRPILFDRFFEVVPLDERHPEALRCSPMGEAVFPEGDQVLRPRESPHPGDEVILSSAASQRLGLLADSETFAGVVQELFRTRRELDHENS